LTWWGQAIMESSSWGMAVTHSRYHYKCMAYFYPRGV
jgi:hypothetical protein